MKKDNKNGFTLVETLVAIAILLLAVAAPLSLATKSLNSSALSKQQITASFLAQEAMEFIRNVRDENVLKDSNWLSNHISKCYGSDGCTVDPTDSGTTKIKACNGSCPLLRYNELTGVYNHSSLSGTADSIYTRTIKIIEIDSNKEIAVKVTVSWKGTNGADYKVIARENLTNWQ